MKANGGLSLWRQRTVVITHSIPIMAVCWSVHNISAAGAVDMMFHQEKPQASVCSTNYVRFGHENTREFWDRMQASNLSCVCARGDLPKTRKKNNQVRRRETCTARIVRVYSQNLPLRLSKLASSRLSPVFFGYSNATQWFSSLTRELEST